MGNKVFSFYLEYCTIIIRNNELNNNLFLIFFKILSRLINNVKTNYTPRGETD